MKIEITMTPEEIIKLIKEEIRRTGLEPLVVTLLTNGGASISADNKKKVPQGPIYRWPEKNWRRGSNKPDAEDTTGVDDTNPNDYIPNYLLGNH